MTLEYALPIILSSDPLVGAQNVSDDGSEFTVVFDSPIVVPRQSITCYVQVDQATLWYNTSNITTTKTSFTVDAEDYELPVGLYSLESLELAVNTLIEDRTSIADTFTFIGNEADSTVTVTGNIAGTVLSWPVEGGFNELLGFTQDQNPSTWINAGDNITGLDAAAFNNTDYYLIHTDLVSRGIRINNKYSQVVDQVLIDVHPGSQLISKPFNPIKVPAEELIGESRKTCRVWLTNQSGTRVDTLGEIWSCRLIITYILQA